MDREIGLTAAMDEGAAAGEIAVRSLAIPLQESSALLVPYASVAEVIGFSHARPGDGPVWFSGYLAWRGRGVPLVRFEPLLGGNGSGGRYRRIVVLHTLNANPRLPFIAVAASGIPRLVQASAQTLQADESRESMQGVLAWVVVNGEPMAIPDIDFLEQNLVRPA